MSLSSHKNNIPMVSHYNNIYFWVRGDTHTTFTLRGRPIFNFSIKGNWIFYTTRHHAEPNINILFTRSLPFDCDVWHWSFPLMMPFYFSWTKLHNRTCVQFEGDVTWFCFCFDSVRSHAPCGCCSIVCLRFQVLQIKQVDCKMTTTNVNN